MIKYILVIFILIFFFIGKTSLAEEHFYIDSKKYEKAIFAGGCFWCMEPPFEKLKGVVDVISGYCGGEKKNPTYKEVSSEKTNYAESIQVTYDPQKITYENLLRIFWMNIDPTAKNRQFVDIGRQYRSIIFYSNKQQKFLAEQSKLKIQQSGKFKKPILTEIIPAEKFYKAEEYHQDYYKKNPVRYKLYRYASGRDAYLNKIWGKK